MYGVLDFLGRLQRSLVYGVLDFLAFWCIVFWIFLAVCEDLLIVVNASVCLCYDSNLDRA